MPAITTIQEENEKSVIRRVLIFNPSISIRRLKKRLEEAGENRIIRTEEYLARMVEEIRLDRIREIESETKEETYAKFSDLVEWVNQQLRAIAQEEKLVYEMKSKDGSPGQKPEVRIFAQTNRIKAINSIVVNVEKLLNMKMDLGLSERKLGTLNARVVELLAVIDYERNNPTIREAEVVTSQSEVGHPTTSNG